MGSEAERNLDERVLWFDQKFTQNVCPPRGHGGHGGENGRYGGYMGEIVDNKLIATK